MAEPIRRSIVEMLASGEHFSGEIEAAVTREFGVGRSAVQHHLAVLRRHEWVIVREEWNQRGYRLDDDVVWRLQGEVRRLKKRWKRRIGWIGGADPLAVRAQPGASRLGRRGHGLDPDDPWRVSAADPRRVSAAEPRGVG